MTKNLLFGLFLCLFLSTFALTEDWKAGTKVILPPVELRAFGVNSAEYIPFESPKGVSRLVLHAESEEKAQLFYHKYLHDLELGGGSAINFLVSPRNTALFFVSEQGWIFVSLDGKTVTFLTAASLDDLGTPISGKSDPPRNPPLPMYLTAWNDHPFRFYYWFDQPKRGVDAREYRYLPEYDWAKERQTGLIGWVDLARNESAEGISQLSTITWGMRAAERRGLPYIINSSLTNYQVAVMNRFAADTQRGMPDFSGAFYCVSDPGHAGNRGLSWASKDGKDAILATLQNVIRETKDSPNVIEYLEVHGELRHGTHDLYLEYGPVADAGYREYLQKKYDNLATVSERWYDDPKHLKSWDDICVPEAASFAGWNERAIDLKGDWKIQAEPSRGDPPANLRRGTREFELWETQVRAPQEWFAENFDDSDWPAIPAPGHDIGMFVHKRNEMVFRRDVTLTEDWLKANPRVWIYVWDLNRWYDRPEQVWINGKLAGEQRVPHAMNNVMVFEASEFLQVGHNSIALRLGEGFLAYKIYLSPDEPLRYPHLKPSENRRWVDLAGWWRQSRLDAVQRGLQMIREVEPDRSIICMSPYSYFAGMRELCAEYGARFHDTGAMSGGLYVDLPALMRGVGLPCSLEPGGIAGDVNELRRFLGSWLVNGTNAVHYFIHLGFVFWDPEQKKFFEDSYEQIQFMGKHHIPRAEVASLTDDRIVNLTSFPLPVDRNVCFPQSPGHWVLPIQLMQEYHCDNLTLYDFEEPEQKNASKYRTVIDMNSTILTPEQVDRIERWVQGGGLFVTYVQTGRHTPEVADSWPISKLTGYKVTGIDKYDDEGRTQWRKITIANKQPVFKEALWPENQRNGNGLSLEKVAPECTDLLYWEDGSVAAGLRPLGKGYVIHLGAKFSENVIWGGNGVFPKVMGQILAWNKTPLLTARAEGVILQHSVTNDGLFDAWTLVNMDRDPKETRLVFIADPPHELVEIGTNKHWTFTKQDDGTWATEPISLIRNESRIFTAPRNEIATAPLNWLNLQREWWKGVWKPDADYTPLPPAPTDHTLDLNADWRFKPLEENDDPAGMIAANYDDSGWETGRLESWTVPEESPAKLRMYRRDFTVPAHWKGGRALLMFQGNYDNPFVGGRGESRFWIDGEEIRSFYRSVPLKDWEAGKTYSVALFVRGWTDVCGPGGNFWISWVPEPAYTLDLGGDWILSKNALNWNEQPSPLPGPVPDCRFARRMFACPEQYVKSDPTQPTQVYIRYEGTRGGWTGVIINGRYLRRSHHNLTEFTHLNITPWVKPNEPNEIILVGDADRGQEITSVRLDFYDE